MNALICDLFLEYAVLPRLSFLPRLGFRRRSVPPHSVRLRRLAEADQEAERISRSAILLVRLERQKEVLVALHGIPFV